MQQQQQHLENVLPDRFLLAFNCLRYLPYVYLDIVSKVNKVGKVQQRLFVLTATHGYSCLPTDGDIQRCFPLSAVTEVIVYQRGNEVALLMPSEYDYLVQVKNAASLQQLLGALSTKKIVESNQPLQRQTQLKLEKPASFQKSNPAPVVISYPRCHRPKLGGLRQHRSSTALSPTKESFPSALTQEALKFDAEVSRGAATRDAAIDFERMVAADDQPAIPWREVEHVADDGATVTAVVSPPQLVADPFGSESDGRRRDRTPSPHSRAGRDGPKLRRDMKSNELMAPIRSPRGVVPSGGQAGGNLEEQLAFERRRNIQYRHMMAELIAAERETSSVLRQVIDDLRAEIDRLSVENMKLRHPSIDY